MTGIQVIAHRGASRAERENTLGAFRRAAAMGADAVELDVRADADGRLVVHHDAHLSDGSPVCRVGAAGMPGHVPALTDALLACEGMWVNLEIKNAPGEPDFDPDDGVATKTVALLAEWGDDERWLISSFRRTTIERCRALRPTLGTAWLCTEPPPGTPGELAANGHRALHPWVGFVTADLVDACHAVGVAVNPWTCDDPVRLAELAECGVDGVCTNVPDIALQALGRA